MARPLRVQFDGARYHVINRGNYQRDVFASPGAAHAFERVLGEACERHAWRLHAHVVMRNHYHLALETPQANLTEGMHWLQSTFCTRFNRLRGICGHVFQGRYQALLVQDDDALFRVINYIHLNPVRAGIVPPTAAATFRWSSLQRFLRKPRMDWLTPAVLLDRLGLEDTRHGWSRYCSYLAALAGDRDGQERQGFGELSRGWAIGTLAWRRELARQHAHRAFDVGLAPAARHELKQRRWQDRLAEILAELRRSETEVAYAAKGAFWKIQIAARLRREVSASHAWIAEVLQLGSPGAVRVAVCRLANK